MENYEIGCFVGRLWIEENKGPSIVKVKDNFIFDITSKFVPTMSSLLELENPIDYVKGEEGKKIISIEDIENDINDKNFKTKIRLLAPCDLQVVKACGVTFAKSMVERVIEERASGDFKKAEELRISIGDLIGDNLKNIVPGSKKAQEVKQLLIKEDLWSQYLEVGIGPDAEVFTKAQVLSSVGHGSEVGLHPVSNWNNPEPEIVLAVNSKVKIVGATLGNDVNLRDIEGRSALLLGKAKDNNASCSIGPFIRLFDETFSIDDVRKAELKMTIDGIDDFQLIGSSYMSEISRDPEDLVKQTSSRHHQYPDGFMLFLGTLFAPTEDRDTKGEGFTHKIGDKVTIKERNLGALVNYVNLSTKCPEWTFGISELFNNLIKRGFYK